MVEKSVTRRCVFCRQIKNTDELFRVARLESGVCIAGSRKVQGRGAYVCRDIKCIAGARDKRGLEKTLKCRVGDEIYAALTELIEDEG